MMLYSAETAWTDDFQLVFFCDNGVHSKIRPNIFLNIVWHSTCRNIMGWTYRRACNKYVTYVKFHVLSAFYVRLAIFLIQCEHSLFFLAKFFYTRTPCKQASTNSSNSRLLCLMFLICSSRIKIIIGATHRAVRPVIDKFLKTPCFFPSAKIKINGKLDTSSPFSYRRSGLLRTPRGEKMYCWI